MSAAAHPGEGVAGVNTAGRRPTPQMPGRPGLRFCPARWVVRQHLTGPGQSLAATLAPVLPAPLFTLIRGGYQAVTTFFVLSGFVLTRSYWSGSLGARRFD